ncbi:pyridoxal phosphate-dependent aminotransferase [Acetohalobium arabaticum]|uniref:Aminotransferase n=1 Tax=Acetohalobium arabaticum (strain ATCC 49924 / DSM 5501 / Z-7288) TaxID=574087 RepID=D9QS90_ACEAZ|nr:pyridoxal phosphate-dependent aminotransferase [Acetohalobium arabaticum]ADL13381.1 L-aspartate aminotransferase apoenzyme [Acetohalobium arabaticum DSM 5501]
MYLTSKVQKIEESPTLAISSKATQMKNQGLDIVGLGAGEPDFETPDHIKEAAIEAIEAGFTNYTTTSGILELKEAICDKLKRENGLEYSPEEIIVSSGAKHSLYNTLQAICGGGDEIIVPTPYWVSYPQQIKLAGGEAAIVETEEENGFKLKPEDLRAGITDKTRGVILNSPSNPTGAVYTEDELTEIAEIAVENGIYIIADEIYEKIYYDEKPVSIASLGKEVRDLTILINGVSKAYSMTGWRIGYAAADSRIVSAMSKLQSHSTSNPNSIAQKASIAALEGSQDPVDKMVAAFEERRNYIVNRINRINGLSAQNPKGAFYLFVNGTELIGSTVADEEITDDYKLADVLLTETRVAVVPGSAFGAPGYLRLSYAASLSELTKALDRIEDLLGIEA